jgi:ATP-dependent protease ClpP protease subunit
MTALEAKEYGVIDDVFEKRVAEKTASDKK